MTRRTNARSDLIGLQAELHAAQAAARLVEQRRAIIARYARLKPGGQPSFCGPTRAERDGTAWHDKGTDDKAIYPDLTSAEAAARELEALGARPMLAYPCRRSRHGHHDLATDEQRMYGRKPKP